MSHLASVPSLALRVKRVQASGSDGISTHAAFFSAQLNHETSSMNGLLLKVATLGASS
jgi:hypothetical protein